MPETTAFRTAFYGRFKNLLQWRELDHLWERLRADAAGGWYVYAVGEPPPEKPAMPEVVLRFVDEIDLMLRREHDERYCGIVYVDDPVGPSFVKIFDPNNLGAVCGSSRQPPLPGWVLSKLQPTELPLRPALANNRRRWWRGLFGTTA